MRRNIFILLAVPMAAIVTAAAPVGLASAMTGTTVPISCAVQADGTANTANQSNSRFITNGDVVNGKILVTGVDQCRVTVTIASWTAPNGGQGKPYSDQKLFNHNTETFGPGKHTIGTRLPDCFFQVDLLRGDQATGSNGTPAYPKGALMGSLHGGSQACVSSPSPTPTPSVSASPSPSSSPSVLGASTQPPSQLPDTGAAAGTMVGFGSMVGAAYAYIRSRRPFRAKA